MTRLTDKDELYKDLVKMHDFGELTAKKAIRVVKNAPTIEAEPVRHGKWIDIDEQAYTWKVRCSCCGNERSMLSTQGKYPNYCEACGARMDK